MGRYASSYSNPARGSWRRSDHDCSTGWAGRRSHHWQTYLPLQPVPLWGLSTSHIVAIMAQRRLRRIINLHHLYCCCGSLETPTHTLSEQPWGPVLGSILSEEAPREVNFRSLSLQQHEILQPKLPRPRRRNRETAETNRRFVKRRKYRTTQRYW